MPANTKRKDICPTCNKAFTSPADLRRHIAGVHLKVRPYKCTQCNQAFTLENTLVLHMRTHTKERPYMCKFEDCKKSFSTSSYCDFEGCDAKFVESGALDVHKRVHTGIRPYKCTMNDCNSAFKTHSGLVIHIRRHLGQKPYICNIDGCTKAFAESGDLSKHKQTHLKERIFKCPYEKCYERFQTNRMLLLHIKDHLGDKRHKCHHKNCSASFVRSESLKYHLTTHTENGIREKRFSENYTHKWLVQRGLNLRREHYLKFTSKNIEYCRIDYTTTKGNVFFCIENDEHSHEGNPISDEVNRMINATEVLQKSGQSLPIVWIRFNPDAYYIDGVKQMTSNTERFDKVVELMDRLIKNQTELKPMNICYLFYDQTDMEPDILYDKEYPEDIKENIIYFPI